jgi:hypothetical protein
MGNTKVIFDLEVNEEGFPPISSEALHATPSEEGGFVIDNTPFFVQGIAAGDRVAATPIPGAGAKYRFARVLASSSNKAISIIFLDPEIKQSVLEDLKSRGCYCEYGEFHKPGELDMLAVSVPESCDYDAVFEYLRALEEAEQLSFAELAV